MICHEMPDIKPPPPVALMLDIGYHGAVAMTTVFSALKFNVDFCLGPKIQHVYSHHTFPWADQRCNINIYFLLNNAFILN